MKRGFNLAAIATLVGIATAFEERVEIFFEKLDSPPPPPQFVKEYISAGQWKDRPKRDKRADRQLQMMHARRR